MFVAPSVTLDGLTRGRFRLYTVTDSSQLCLGSEMIALWGADISPANEFPAARTGCFGLGPPREAQDTDDDSKQ